MKQRFDVAWLVRVLSIVRRGCEANVLQTADLLTEFVLLGEAQRNRVGHFPFKSFAQCPER